MFLYLVVNGGVYFCHAGSIGHPRAQGRRRADPIAETIINGAGLVVTSLNRLDVVALADGALRVWPDMETAANA
jgi:hypothetical protein